MNKVFKKKALLFSLVLVLACVAIWSVFTWKPSEPTYPKLLVEADSAIVQGHYGYADTLLALYDNRQADSQRPMKLYRQLLDLNRRYVEDRLITKDLNTIDSLSSYYEDYGTRDKYARILLFQAKICQLNRDYPAVVNLCLEAEDMIRKQYNPVLLEWVLQLKGDLFFDQRMFNECEPCYREYYDIAQQNDDPLRMAFGAARMGRLYSIKSDVDSILLYYKMAIEIASDLPDIDLFVKQVKSALCDIYIQLEDYEQAATIMPRDSLNIDNWAYWHLGQGHIDSATVYFKQMLGHYDKYVDTQTLRMLAMLAKESGNEQQAISYYEQMAIAEDSLKAQSQAEAMHNALAQYNYNNMVKERDRIKSRKHQEELFVGVLFIVFCVATLLFYFMWKLNQRKTEMVLVHEQLVAKEKEEQYKQSQNQLELNRKQLEELEQQLELARRQSNPQKTERLEMEAKVLEAQNASIEALQQQRELLTKEMEMSDLYRRLKLNDGVTKRSLSDREWNLLAINYIDKIYDRMTNRLLSLADLSTIELRICYMVKLGVAPADMADVLCRTVSAVSQSRRRIYKKLTGQSGSATQLDELIAEF